MVILVAAHPTLPSSQASISSQARGNPPDSSICRLQTARSAACHHSSSSVPIAKEPGCSEILAITASASPSVLATSHRCTTRPISSEGSTRESVVEPATRRNDLRTAFPCSS
jgi:hypothetical protein